MQASPSAPLLRSNTVQQASVFSIPPCDRSQLRPVLAGRFEHLRLHAEAAEARDETPELDDRCDTLEDAHVGEADLLRTRTSAKAKTGTEK